MTMDKLISIVIPVYNEEKNIPLIYEKVKAVMDNLPYRWELIFVNDGSRDRSILELNKLEDNDNRVRILDFSRNFGKEIATTAGVNHCLGDACIMIDGDLQHPVEKIPDFVKKWENGAEVVIGVRDKNKGEGLVKKLGSYFFYIIINKISSTEIVTRATDFRLLDRAVIDEFNKFTEVNRMTRALIDWLGFRRAYVNFTANERLHGKPSYNFWKLMRLAFHSFISFSLFPLRLAGYIGIMITILSGVLGLFILITKYILGIMDFSATAMLAVLILFLIGIVLISLGLIALYIANIHSEVIDRPIYVIRKNRSRNGGDKIDDKI